MPHKGFSMFFLLGALWCFASVIGWHMLLIYAVGCHPFSSDSWFSGPCRLTRRLLVFHSTSDSSFFAPGPEWQTTFGRIIVGLVLASIRSTAWPRELGVIGYHNAVVSIYILFSEVSLLNCLCSLSRSLPYIWTCVWKVLYHDLQLYNIHNIDRNQRYKS